MISFAIRLITCAALWAGTLVVPGFHSCLDAVEPASTPVQRSIRVEFRNAGTNQTVVGRPVVQAADGGVLLMSDAGRLWTIQPENIIQRDDDVGPYEPIDDREAIKRLGDEFGGAFHVFQTAHYIIVYNGDQRHAKAVGELLEQIYKGFNTFWRNKRFPISPSSLPMVAMVFRDEASFRAYADAEIGDLARTLIGYYHLETNRIITYNVPHWERNVSTVIHEATHQLAYNVGLQTRLADNPTWVSEGLAMFFESPDRRNPKRWRGIGGVNEVNLRRWWKYFPRRPSESLATLIAGDDRFQNAQSAPDAYGEAWALTYFLIKSRDKQYYEYLRRLSEGQPMVQLSKRERIEMFESAFESTLGELDRDFLKFMRKVRIR